MVCPNCQGNISNKKQRCERCGTDLTLYKKIIKASNLHYNNGLARANIRDLSGAIISLKNSLKLNKCNTDARNLLGLVYFEMGETVAALSEWVISKHFNPENNNADEYINAIQSNPTKLDSLNQAIKRYNTALNYVRQGSDDLAMLQLKKITSLNPHFIRAYHLLALLHMKIGENERAKKCLIRASKIDVSNTTTLRYMRELEPQMTLAKEMDGDRESDRNLTSSIVPVSTYKEDKPNIMAFVNLVIGVFIGLAVMGILVIPSIKKKQTSGSNADYVDYSAGMAALEANEATITALQKDKETLEEQVGKLESQIDAIVIPEANPINYDALFEAAEAYMDELAKNERDQTFTGVAEMLYTIDTSKFESAVAKDLYQRLTDEVYPNLADDYYDAGHDKYSNGDYEEALVSLLKAYEFNPEDVNAIYFIGRAYHRLRDYENASVYYTIVTTDFNDSKRYKDAASYLEQVNIKLQSQ